MCRPRRHTSMEPFWGRKSGAAVATPVRGTEVVRRGRGCPGTSHVHSPSCVLRILDGGRLGGEFPCKFPRVQVSEGLLDRTSAQESGCLRRTPEEVPCAFSVGVGV